MKKLPFEDKVLSSAETADVSSKKELKQSSLIYLLDMIGFLFFCHLTAQRTHFLRSTVFLATDTTTVLLSTLTTCGQQ